MSSSRKEVVDFNQEGDSDPFALSLEVIKKIEDTPPSALPVEVAIDAKMHPPAFIEKT